MKSLNLLSYIFIISTLGFSPLLASAKLSQNVAKKIDNWIQGEMTKDKIPGMAIGISLLNSNGAPKTAYVNGYGVADVNADGKKAYVDKNTMFRIASISKSFAAHALLSTLDSKTCSDNRGYPLHLDTPILTINTPLFQKLYLMQKNGKLRDNEYWPKVTIRQILNHRSGLELDFYGRDKWADYQTASSNREMNEEELIKNLDKMGFAYDPENFPANAPEKYSNAGFNFVGAIIAQCKNRNEKWANSFQKIIRSQIFNPLKMRARYNAWTHKHYRVSSGYSTIRKMNELVKPGEIWLMGRIQAPNIYYPNVSSPSTGVAVSAKAMTKYMNWHLHAFLESNSSLPTLIGADGLDMLIREYRVLNGNNARVSGYHWERRNGVLGIGHTGTERSHRSMMLVFPQHGLGITIMSNAKDTFRQKYLFGIYEILAKELSLPNPELSDRLSQLMTQVRNDMDAFANKKKIEARFVLTAEALNASKKVLGEYESRLNKNISFLINDKGQFAYQSGSSQTALMPQEAHNSACHPYSYKIPTNSFLRGSLIRFECDENGQIESLVMANGMYYRPLKK